MLINGLRMWLFAMIATGFLSAVTPASAADTLVSTNLTTVWKYLDDGSDQGAAWRAVGFNDSSWSNGVPQFGYGDADVTTVVNSNRTDGTRIITTYFRHVFTNDLLDVNNLLIRLIRDDGAAIYINGTEVFRNNLPAGPIAFNTLAVAAAPDENTR